MEWLAFPSYNYLFKQVLIDNRFYLLIWVRLVQRLDRQHLHRRRFGALYEENLFLCPYGCTHKRERGQICYGISLKTLDHP